MLFIQIEPAVLKREGRRNDSLPLDVFGPGAVRLDLKEQGNRNKKKIRIDKTWIPEVTFIFVFTISYSKNIANIETFY